MSLKIWLPLDGDLRNLGTSEIKWICSAVTDSGGKIGQCYYFSGSTYITENTYDWTNFNNKQFSVCCWYKEPSVASGNSQMICIGTNSGWNNIRIGLLRRTGNGYPMFSVSDGSTAIQYNFTATAFTLNTWNHIAVTYDNGNLSMYINGILDKTMTTTITPVLNNSQHLGIGAASNGAEKLLGYLNDVRIYDHCLSAAEVKEISQGLVVHYKLDTQYFKSGTNLVTDVTKGGQTTKLTDGRLGVVTSGTNADTYFTINLSESITNGTTYHFSCDASGISEGQFWNFPFGAQNNSSLPCKIYNGHNEYTFTANDINWGTNRLFMDDVNRTDWANPATFYNFVLTKDATYEVKDSSGYNNHGIINDPNAQFVNITPRYLTCIKNSQANNSATYPIKGECNIPESTALTFSWWMNPTSWGAQTSGIFSTSNGSATDYNTTAANMRDSCFDCCNTSGTCVRISVASHLTLNEWHHYALTYNGSQLIFYKDGVSKVTANQTGALKAFQYIYPFYSKAGGVNRCTSGSLSDFRIYVTALDAIAIKQLYEIGAKVDNLGGIHAFEMLETNKNSIKKTGIIQGLTFFENGYNEILHYDKTIYTEPDGSTWVRVFHHNDPTTSGYFTRTSDWEHGVYKSSNAWYDIEEILYNLVAYEFMVKQKTTSSAAETKYRWVQNINPIEATYNDVKPGTVTFNTTSGYTNSSYGGLWRMNSSARMCIANSSSGNWYGALGSWTTYSTNQVPGFPNTNISTGYIDLYVRIYSTAKVINNIGINSLNFIEL